MAGATTLWIALFRGINVGGKNKLRMADLTDTLTSLGCVDISTYIQSGNVAFQHIESSRDALSPKIGDSMMQRHGYSPRVILLTKQQLAGAIRQNPFKHAESEPKTLHLWFMEGTPTCPDLAAIESLKLTNESYALHDNVFYLHAPEGIGRSKLAARVERLLGTDATSRNWRTIVKLAEMAEIDIEGSP